MPKDNKDNKDKNDKNDKNDEGDTAEEKPTSKLSDSIVFWTTIIIHVTLLVLSISLTNVDVIFEYGGSIGTGSVMFLIPALAYLVALRRYGSTNNCDTLFYLLTSYAFLLMLLIILSFSVYLQILKATG